MAADQYCVGGEGGLWVGDNWAEAADGTGAAWVDGSRGVFTTTPAAVDLAGFSPTATYLTGSGRNIARTAAAIFVAMHAFAVAGAKYDFVSAPEAPFKMSAVPVWRGHSGRLSVQARSGIIYCIPR